MDTLETEINQWKSTNTHTHTHIHRKKTTRQKTNVLKYSSIGRNEMIECTKRVSERKRERQREKGEK